jgi:hypothetical protein
VLFRHKEHVTRFGLRCASCHHRDSCSNCHDAQANTIAHKPLRPGKTWADSHGPCMNCHKDARCVHCHYKDDQPPPASFDHASTGQALSVAHAELRCVWCHEDYAFAEPPACGGSSCHGGTERSYPRQRPGRVVQPRQATTERATAER